MHEHLGLLAHRAPAGPRPGRPARAGRIDRGPELHRRRTRGLPPVSERGRREGGSGANRGRAGGGARGVPRRTGQHRSILALGRIAGGWCDPQPRGGGARRGATRAARQCDPRGAGLRGRAPAPTRNGDPASAVPSMAGFTASRESRRTGARRKPARSVSPPRAAAGACIWPRRRHIAWQEVRPCFDSA